MRAAGGDRSVRGSRLADRVGSRVTSKSIRFGLMSNQEIQRVAEFHVFERNLYQMPQRAPLKNGILDPRLVRRSRRTADAAPPACFVEAARMRRVDIRHLLRRERRTRRASA